MPHFMSMSVTAIVPTSVRLAEASATAVTIIRAFGVHSVRLSVAALFSKDWSNLRGKSNTSGEPCFGVDVDVSDLTGEGATSGSSVDINDGSKNRHGICSPTSADDSGDGL